MLTQEDIGHEVGDPNAHWDMRGELLSLSDPGPWGSVCQIRLVGTGEVLDIGARGFIRTNGKPVHKSEAIILEDRWKELTEARKEIDRNLKEVEEQMRQNRWKDFCARMAYTIERK